MSKPKRKHITDRATDSLIWLIYRALPRVAGHITALLRGLVSSRCAITLCVILLIAEVTLLGLGVVGRVQQAGQKALDIARLNMAAIEAREFGRDLSRRNAASISASTQASVSIFQDDEQADTPPPLQPRNLETILAEEAGYDILSEGSETDNSSADEDQAEDDSNHSSSDTIQDDSIQISDHKLTAEQIEELDRLIREGVSCMIAGDMRACILNLEAAYELHPDHPALLYYYGMAYDKLLNPGKAREYYTRVFHMREKAGKYFQRASRRLTYGLAQPSDMRGKLAFGPHQIQHTYDLQNGENVHILLPIMLAPGEEVRPEDIVIDIQVFDLINGRKIEFNRLAKPQLSWENEVQEFQNWEENLFVTYTIPPLTQEQLDVFGDVRYYGFTAKLSYKGEPLDCISSPSALILHEQILTNRRPSAYGSGLLPDDGLAPSYEEALPVSDYLDELTPAAP